MFSNQSECCKGTSKREQKASWVQASLWRESSETCHVQLHGLHDHP